jgi:uncharacterized protein (TIGR00369 family)
MLFQPTDPYYEKRVRASFVRQPFMDLLGAQLLTVRPGLCEITLPYKKELSQQHGFFHAGTIGTIADNAAGYAAYSLMDADASILTVEFKLNLLAHRFQRSHYSVDERGRLVREKDDAQRW